MSEENGIVNYVKVAELLSKLRSAKNEGNYKENAIKLCDELHISKEDNGSYSVVTLDAILIGIFQKRFGISKIYYSKFTDEDSDKDEEGDKKDHHLYYRMLNGHGLLEGYYHHGFVSDDWVFEEFYPARKRTLHFLQKSTYLDYDQRSESNGQEINEKSKDFRRIETYCGNKEELKRHISSALNSFKTLKELHDFYDKCIEKNTEDGELKLPRNPYRRSETRCNVGERPPYCTGRDEILTAIRDEFEASGRIQILYGQAGVGKTTVAKEYAYRYQEKYQTICWVNASDLSTIADSYKEFLLTAEISEGEMWGLTGTRTRFYNYFRDATANWLLIYDNADYLDNSDGLDDFRNKRNLLASWLPENSLNGHILITSRCDADFMRAKRRQLDVLAEEQALTCLRDFTGMEPDDAAKAVAENLGHLPLALSYAGAYIKSLNITYSDYLEIWDKHWEKVQDNGSSERGKYYDIVRTAFQITEDQLKSAAQSQEDEQFSSAVLQFLNICAYTAPDNISLIPYIEGAKYLPENLMGVLEYERKTDRFETELVKYSLFDKTGELTYSTHRLLQEIIRDKHTEDEAKTWINRSWKPLEMQKDIIMYSMPVPERRSLLNLLIPHARAVLRWYAPYINNEEEIEQLCLRYANWHSQWLFWSEDEDWSRMREKETDSLTDLLDYLRLFPHGELTYLAVQCHDELADRNKNWQQFSLASEHYSVALKLTVAIFDKHLCSPVKGFDANGLFVIASICHDIFKDHIMLGDDAFLLNSNYYADKMLQIAEKISREAKELDCNEIDPGEVVYYVRSLLVWAYEIKYKLYLFYDQRFDNPEKEEIIALGEIMLRKEKQDRMHPIIKNIITFIDEHYSKIEKLLAGERVQQPEENYVDSKRRKFDLTVQNIVRQMLPVIRA